MTLKKQVQNLMQDGEKFIEVSPFCYMRLMADGSAMIYKIDLFKSNDSESIIESVEMPDGNAIVYKNKAKPKPKPQEMILSRHDLEFIKHMALPVPMFTPELEENRDVHTEHCCVIHGCKYGKDDCTVTTDTKRQSHACESCYNDAEGFCG